MDDQTRQFGRDDSGNNPERPRQYFPNQGASQQPQYETQYGGYDANYDANYNSGYDNNYDNGYGNQPYNEPYHPDNYSQPAAQPAREKGGAGSLVFGILFFLALLAAVVLFFLWRGAQHEANQPPPAPVTVTQTTTATTTESGFSLPTEWFSNDGTAPTLPSELPSDIPTELPPEVSQGADEVQQWLDGLINDIEGALQGQ